jgi:mono/diheme cytochrome c family protein
LSLFLAGGCDWHVRQEPREKPVPANQVVDFGELYDTHCSGCHGKDGQSGPAPPLNDPIFLAIVPDPELHRVIAEGRPGTLMPAWAESKGGALTDPQVDVLAKGIKERWQAAAAPAADIPPYAAPAGQAGGNRDAGARVFAMACAGCHGDDGRGGKVGAVNDRAFLELLSDQALRRFVITGRPDLDMPAFNKATPGRDEGFKPLTSAEVGDLVALLASWRGGGSPGEK